MDPVTVLLVLLLAVASALCGVGIWALTEFVKTARSVRELSDSTNQRLTPLLDKVDITVDAVNAELLRLDEIITRFDDASAKMSSASGTISDIVNAPADLLNDFADRVRKAWKERRRAQEASDLAVAQVVGDAPATDV